MSNMSSRSNYLSRTLYRFHHTGFFQLTGDVQHTVPVSFCPEPSTTSVTLDSPNSHLMYSTQFQWAFVQDPLLPPHWVFPTHAWCAADSSRELLSRTLYHFCHTVLCSYLNRFFNFDKSVTCVKKVVVGNVLGFLFCMFWQNFIQLSEAL